jgi:hypothetical protein
MVIAMVLSATFSISNQFCVAVSFIDGGKGVQEENHRPFASH